MSGLIERVDNEEIRSRLIELAAKLESGERISAEPLEIIAAIALAALENDGPPLVQAPPRRPKLRAAASETALAELWPKASQMQRLAVSAGLLQMLDFWEESHETAQTADDFGEKAFSAYWHAIAHRREPDPGNAGYWFRRVGRHPVFSEIAKSVEPMIANAKPVPALLRNGVWDPMAFVTFCGDATRKPGSEFEKLARSIQKIEMLRLLDATVRLASGK